MDPDERSPLLHPMGSNGAGRPLFCIAPAMGGVFHFRELAEEISEDQPLFVVEPRVSASGVHPYHSLEDLAECCIGVIRTKQPQGPFRLIGFSFGGLISWEIARNLERKNECVDLLILIDTAGRPDYDWLTERRSWAKWIRVKWEFLVECRRVRKQYDTSLPANWMARLVWGKLSHLWIKFYRRFYPEKRSSDEAEEINFAERIPAQSKLRAKYDIGKYDGSVHLIRSGLQRLLYRDLDYDLGWGKHIPDGQLTIHTSSGDHMAMVKPPHVAHLGKLLNSLLNKASDDLIETIHEEVAVSKLQEPLHFPEPQAGDSLMLHFQKMVAVMPDQVALRDGGARISYRGDGPLCKGRCMLFARIRSGGNRTGLVAL